LYQIPRLRVPRNERVPRNVIPRRHYVEHAASITQAATFRVYIDQRASGDDVVGEARLDRERLQLGAERGAARGGGGAERGAEGEGAGSKAPGVHGPEQAPCVRVRAGGDVRGEEGVPGDRVGARDLVEHPARGGEDGAVAGPGRGGGGVGGEELVPGRRGGDAGLEEGGVGPGGGEGEVLVVAAAHAQRRR